MSSKKSSYNFLVMGPQGSGKGTQAELLAEKFKLKFIGTGDMLRRAAKQKTAFGKKVDLIINKKGKLVPSAWVVKMAREEIKKLSKNKGLVFDGFARRLPEAKAFNQLIKKAGRQLTAVFLINISARETVKRLSKRRQCQNNHLFISGVTLKKSQKACPQCGAKIFQREDDRPDAIKERLRTYHQSTMPSVRYFKKLGLLVEINGEQSVKKVFQEILCKLSSYESTKRYESTKTKKL